jgi:hypothetical protein
MKGMAHARINEFTRLEDNTEAAVLRMQSCFPLKQHHGFFLPHPFSRISTS